VAAKELPEDYLDVQRAVSKKPENAQKPPKVEESTKKEKVTKYVRNAKISELGHIKDATAKLVGEVEKFNRKNPKDMQLDPGPITAAFAEAVENALKHAGGATVRIMRVSGEKRGIEVVIKDEGPGIPKPLISHLNLEKPGGLPDDGIGIDEVLIESQGDWFGLGVKDPPQMEDAPAKGTRVTIRAFVPDKDSSK